MTIDPTTGIDFGNIKYTITETKGNGSLDGYKITLENGISIFIRKENIQKGAKIELKEPTASFYANNVRFIGFNHVSIFGSDERDQIEVQDGQNVYVNTSNNEHGDEVSFIYTKTVDKYTNQFKGDGKDLLRAPYIQLPPKDELKFGL